MWGMGLFAVQLAQMLDGRLPRPLPEWQLWLVVLAAVSCGGLTAGLNRLTGRQLAAIRASLPVPTINPLLTVPGRRLHDDEELVLSVASAPETSTASSVTL